MQLDGQMELSETSCIGKTIETGETKTITSELITVLMQVKLVKLIKWVNSLMLLKLAKLAV